MSYPELGLLIDGQWHRASATTLPVLNPADETVLGALPVATSTHIAAAVAACLFHADELPGSGSS